MGHLPSRTHLRPLHFLHPVALATIRTLVHVVGPQDLLDSVEFLAVALVRGEQGVYFFQEKAVERGLFIGLVAIYVIEQGLVSVILGNIGCTID